MDIFYSIKFTFLKLSKTVENRRKPSQGSVGFSLNGSFVHMYPIRPTVSASIHVYTDAYKRGIWLLFLSTLMPIECSYDVHVHVYIQEECQQGIFR